MTFQIAILKLFSLYYTWGWEAFCFTFLWLFKLQCLNSFSFPFITPGLHFVLKNCSKLWLEKGSRWKKFWFCKKGQSPFDSRTFTNKENRRESTICQEPFPCTGFRSPSPSKSILIRALHFAANINFFPNFHFQLLQKSLFLIVGWL